MINCNLPSEFSSSRDLTKTIFKVLDKDRDSRITLDEFLDGAQNINIVVNILQCNPATD